MGATMVTARVDPLSKERAEAVLRAQGMTSSQAIRRLYERIGQTGQLPDFLLDDGEYERLVRAERRRTLVERFRYNRLPHSPSDAAVAAMLDEARAARYA